MPGAELKADTAKFLKTSAKLAALVFNKRRTLE
jgi:hypothetical protein